MCFLFSNVSLVHCRSGPRIMKTLPPQLPTVARSTEKKAYFHRHRLERLCLSAVHDRDSMGKKIIIKIKLGRRTLGHACVTRQPASSVSSSMKQRAIERAESDFTLFIALIHTAAERNRLGAQRSMNVPSIWAAFDSSKSQPLGASSCFADKSGASLRVWRCELRQWGAR